MFVHLHIHSYYSMMWGTAPLDALGRHLCGQGQEVFPLTDRNGIYGMVKHIQLCRELGLRPIIGCELVAGEDQALCLVKTRQGYRHLCQMLTAYNRDSRWRLSEALAERHEGLVVITQSERVIQSLTGVGDLYIELSPGRVARALELQAAYKLPLVVTGRAYMISERAQPLHRLLRAIDTNSKLSRLDPNEVMPLGSSLFANAAMAERFAAFPKALSATREIAEACRFVPGLGEPIFPPSDYEQSFKALRDKTYAGLQRRYGKVSDTICDRADYELDMIRRKGFSNCFLVVEDVTSRFSLTCGRGSAAASIVAYALGITHVDPIAHNLFFERFLNPGRKDPPDIDIDFAWDERDRVRDYLWQKYGGSHIAMVCNHNHVQMASAVREIAKVYGLGEKEIGAVRHQLSSMRRIGAKPELAEPWPEILAMARRIVDYPRHISVHCGGVVITPDDITNHCPLRPMPIGYDVVPWEKDAVEDYGFVKLDFLGNRSLAVIRDCLSAIRENYAVDIDYQKLNPLGDPQAQALIESGDTMGCFYVESPATRQLLQKTGHGDFETLVAVSSIIRPAANVIATEWVKRHRWMQEPGNQPNWRPLHPLLEEVLAETHGLMVYQEDVTRVAMAVAGFNAVDGDVLRKIISKKHKEKQLRDYHRKFCDGCIEKGLSQEQIDEIWAMIQSFAGYSFCKPHSASYALVSYKSAFLKFHYPAEFMAAVISNQGGFYSTYAYLSHARRRGIRVLGPCVNESRVSYRGHQGCIRLGLMQIKSLKTETMTRILAAREAGDCFRDLSDFMHRVKIGLEETKRLILAGCFDALEPGSNRPTLIWQAIHWHARHQRQSEDLFNDYIRREDLPRMRPYGRAVIQALERKLFGFVLSSHPLAGYAGELKRSGRIRARNLRHFVNRTITLAGVLITGKTVMTKHDEAMSFLTFEDETDIYEAVLFPEMFRNYAPLLDYAKLYLVRGEVVCDMGALALTIHEIVRLDLRRPVRAGTIDIDEAAKVARPELAMQP